MSEESDALLHIADDHPCCKPTLLWAHNRFLALERENAALKEALDAQMQYQRELRADRDRLDWLCMTDHWFDVPCDGNWKPESFRAAIDAAMGVKP